MDYLDCGKIYKSRMAVDFLVSKINDITNKIIPFFNKYNIVGIKSQDFQYFKKVAFLIKNRDHLTVEGINNISKIKSKMNKGRVFVNSSVEGFKKPTISSKSINNKRKFSTLRKNTDFTTLRKISEHITKHKSNLTDLEFGYFLAGRRRMVRFKSITYYFLWKRYLFSLFNKKADRIRKCL